jgi:S-adenosylmethionine:tRNA ribosyltransferase-isomerase
VRTLEYAADTSGKVAAGIGDCDLFIYPGYRFKAVDALITNFHLPQSTLIMLVAAFAGRRNVLQAYQEAIRRRYRFYSYGDAMLIL